jgi:hypothetical protein
VSPCKNVFEISFLKLPSVLLVDFLQFSLAHRLQVLFPEPSLPPLFAASFGEAVLVVPDADVFGRLPPSERVRLQEGVDEGVVLKHLAGEVQQPRVALIVLKSRNESLLCFFFVRILVVVKSIIIN